MKRLVGLILVLCLVSSAGATLQISVNGEFEPIDSEITIMVSDHLTLDIWTNAVIGPFEGGPWMLVCDTTMGDISGGLSVHTAMTIAGATEDFPDIIPPAGEEGVWGIAFNINIVPIQAGTLLVGEIDFHCLCVGDCVISLYKAIEDFGVGQLFDQVIIHQIVPEPATVLLLGLGAPLLRKRRRG